VRGQQRNSLKSLVARNGTGVQTGAASSCRKKHLDRCREPAIISAFRAKEIRWEFSKPRGGVDVRDYKD
jgi:hypothetical protein